MSFLNDTAQGRLQRSLSGIRARRLAAEEEKAAKVQQQEQRAASLKRWIIKECARHRERKASLSAATWQGNTPHSSPFATLGNGTEPFASTKSTHAPGHPETRVHKQPQQAGKLVFTSRRKLHTSDFCIPKGTGTTFNTLCMAIVLQTPTCVEGNGSLPRMAAIKLRIQQVLMKILALLHRTVFVHPEETMCRSVPVMCPPRVNIEEGAAFVG